MPMLLFWRFDPGYLTPFMPQWCQNKLKTDLFCFLMHYLHNVKGLGACSAAKVVQTINITALINPTTSPLINVSAIDLPAKRKNVRAVSCFFICWLCCISWKGEEALISLNNSSACVDLIPLARATPLMVSLSLTVRGTKEHSAFPV